MVTIVYDSCDAKINPNSIVIQEERFADGLINTFFVCPSCGKKHYLLYHDDKTKELQAKIQSFDNNHHRAKKKALVQKLRARIDLSNSRMC